MMRRTAVSAARRNFQSPYADISASLSSIQRRGERAVQRDETLDSMANGGIYDHVGYGFARYSTDDEWLVPHFEKCFTIMLYC
ncbi:hypothetical protein PO124_30780 [Bacillus licheniformis]|nr:hypothetical protein [Bacillus licheniformis]